MTREDLIAAVLALPRAERLRVARELLRSLDDEVSADAWEAAWSQEIRRRLDDLDADVPGVAFDALLTELERAGDPAG